MLHQSIQVRDSPVEGKGLFATVPIKQGEIVWRLDIGEPQLTHEELMVLPEAERSLAFQFKDRYIICHEGSQYMNHSCDPNAWWVSDTELAARWDISAGEEVTYDYVTADVAPPWRADWQCNCGSPLCRTNIASTDCLEETFQERFAGHLPSWVDAYIASQSISARS